MTDQTAEAVRWLHVEKGESITAIARKMNMTTGAVSNALRRAQGRTPTTRHSDAGKDASRFRDPIPANLRHVQRDPCMKCGVRRDVHDENGCRRWVGEPA